jgi:hypothetical protein
MPEQEVQELDLGALRNLAHKAYELDWAYQVNKPNPKAAFNVLACSLSKSNENVANALLDTLDYLEQLKEENKRLRARVDELENVVLASMANESQLMRLYEDFDSGEER